MKQRLCFLENEIALIRAKVLSLDMSVPKLTRLRAQFDLVCLRHAMKIRIKNRCILTGRAKANYEQFRLSRLSVRSLAHQGLLLGVSKASW
jgi:small subunit ribosomal protein S14